MTDESALSALHCALFRRLWTETTIRNASLVAAVLEDVHRLAEALGVEPNDLPLPKAANDDNDGGNDGDLLCNAFGEFYRRLCCLRVAESSAEQLARHVRIQEQALAVFDGLVCLGYGERMAVGSAVATAAAVGLRRGYLSIVKRTGVISRHRFWVDVQSEYTFGSAVECDVVLAPLSDRRVVLLRLSHNKAAGEYRLTRTLPPVAGDDRDINAVVLKRRGEKCAVEHSVALQHGDMFRIRIGPTRARFFFVGECRRHGSPYLTIVAVLRRRICGQRQQQLIVCVVHARVRRDVAAIVRSHTVLNATVVNETASALAAVVALKARVVFCNENACISSAAA